MKEKVAIYCRLSEEDKNKQSIADESGSIQNQKAMLCDYAERQEWEIYGIYSDDDYAGADRNHRVAEVLAVCRDADIDIFPHNLPNFQRDEFDRIIPLRQPFFMTSRMLKWFGGDDAANKSNFTRLVGTLFVGETDYFVYNTRCTLMKWSGSGELKAKINVRCIADKVPFDIAYSMLFADSGEIAMRAFLSTHKIQNSNYHFHGIYEKVHYIPLNEYGARYLRFFTVIGWHDYFTKLLLELDELPEYGYYDHDDYTDGVYSLVWLDGDLRRLWAASELKGNLCVYCFDWQKDFVRNFLGENVEILTVNFDKVEQRLTYRVSLP